MVSECSEVFVQFGLVLIRVRYSRFEIVRNDCLGSSAVEMKGVLAGVDEILLLLTQDSLDIRELRAREDGDEHFDGDLLSGLLVDEVKPVSGKVHVHPVSGLVLQVSNWGGLDEIVLKDSVELGTHVSIRIFLAVQLEDHLFGYSFLPKHPGIFRHPFHEFFISVGSGNRRMLVRILVEEVEKRGFV